MRMRGTYRILELVILIVVLAIICKNDHGDSFMVKSLIISCILLSFVQLVLEMKARRANAGQAQKTETKVE
jgi:hypothetical protein